MSQRSGLESTQFVLCLSPIEYVPTFLQRRINNMKILNNCIISPFLFAFRSSAQSSTDFYSSIPCNSCSSLMCGSLKTLFYLKRINGRFFFSRITGTEVRDYNHQNSYFLKLNKLYPIPDFLILGYSNKCWSERKEDIISSFKFTVFRIPINIHIFDSQCISCLNCPLNLAKENAKLWCYSF